MPSDSDGISKAMDHDPGGKRKPPKRSQDVQRENDDFYKPFYKLNYKRVFPELIGMAEYTVFIESRKEGVKLGNANPLILAGFFKNEIKELTNIRIINASKVGVVFARTINANDFLKNESFLEKYD
ncbi:unnamed protein product [Parnassius apollo]|uniref:(apollo) hypothetical protein n=1 Tax=Parnassius apollo TaxID=110799 RepID=A0A8S3XRW9_PARAO|nr:unnamed protein product [Parnassius apollo]